MTVKVIGYCYHSINAISFRVSQSNHIKRLPLYSTYKNEKNIKVIKRKKKKSLLTRFSLFFFFCKTKESSRRVLNVQVAICHNLKIQSFSSRPTPINDRAVF